MKATVEQRRCGRRQSAGRQRPGLRLCCGAGDCCAAATVQEHDTCMDIVFPRMAWVASVDEVINAIRV